MVQLVDIVLPTGLHFSKHGNNSCICTLLHPNKENPKEMDKGT